MITAKKRENPMAVRSKNALASALLKLMLRQDFAEISISDITERARLSRQTFYTNFQRKEDILLYLLDGLFARYQEETAQNAPDAEHLIVDYFIFWNSSRDFLSLLFRRGLGHLFQERNRRFFQEASAIPDAMITAEPWQLPYVRASLAGLTYELIRLWVTESEGLSVSVLSAMTIKLLNGGIFNER